MSKIKVSEIFGPAGYWKFLVNEDNSHEPTFVERLWAYRVEVRETQSNMAFREGHREWNEDLLGEF